MAESKFSPYVKQMAEFCNGRSPQNQCIFAVDSDGDLWKDEVPGAHGHSFIGEFEEQIQFRGGAIYVEIKARVDSMGYWLSKGEQNA